MTPTPAAGGDRMTGLAAVRFAVNTDGTIRARFPSGTVVLVSAAAPNVPDLAGTSAQWGVSVADHSTQGVYQFAVTSTRVDQRAVTSLIGQDSPPIVDLAAGAAIADVMDSDQAVRAAEGLGGADYRQRTGADVLSLALGGFAGRSLEWRVFYSKQLTDHQTTVVIDARTGELLRVEGKDPEFVPKAQ